MYSPVYSHGETVWTVSMEASQIIGPRESVILYPIRLLHLDSPYHITKHPIFTVVPTSDSSFFCRHDCYSTNAEFFLYFGCYVIEVIGIAVDLDNHASILD